MAIATQSFRTLFVGKPSKLKPNAYFMMWCCICQTNYVSWFSTNNTNLTSLAMPEVMLTNTSLYMELYARLYRLWRTSGSGYGSYTISLTLFTRMKSDGFWHVHTHTLTHHSVQLWTRIKSKTIHINLVYQSQWAISTSENSRILQILAVNNCVQRKQKTPLYMSASLKWVS